MELNEDVADEVTVVAVVGRMDAAGARRFSEHMTALVQGGHAHLLIDASRLDFVGSMGLRALMLGVRLAAEAQGRLVLCGLTAPVRRVVELGGFAKSFENYASRAEALASFAAAR